MRSGRRSPATRSAGPATERGRHRGAGRGGPGPAVEGQARTAGSGAGPGRGVDRGATRRQRARPLVGSAASWSARGGLARLFQVSTIRPSATRTRVMPASRPAFLVGARPRKGAVWVPQNVQRAATVSPSEFRASREKRQSGKASYNSATLCLCHALPRGGRRRRARRSRPRRARRSPRGAGGRGPRRRTAGRRPWPASRRRRPVLPHPRRRCLRVRSRCSTTRR
jgi:hypothetical protein